MKYFLGTFVLVIAVGIAAPASASDLVISRTLIEDPAGNLAIADVARLPGTPVSENMSLDNGSSVFWMRLQVHAPDHGSKAVLFIRPTYLNEVRLYEADAGNPAHWKMRVTGNYYPYRSRERASISLGFQVDISAPVATYYLRVKAQAPSSIDVQAIEPEEADRLDHQRDLLELFFVTSMMFLLGWAIQSYLLDRQRVVAIFALHQAVYTLFGIEVTGYLAPIAPANVPHLLDWLSTIFYLGINFTLALFCRELFKAYNPPTVFTRILNLQVMAFPVLLVAFATGHETFAVYGNAILIRLGLVFFVVVAFSLRSEGSPSRRTLQAFFLAILMTNVVFWSAGRFLNLSLSAAQTLVADGLVIGGLFAWTLHTRARQLQLEAHRAAFELLIVQRQFEAEQELKRKMEIQARTDDLTGVCNRRYLMELAELELARAIRFQRPMTLLAIDIDHFKKINDSWGHGVGDEVLQHVSHLMRETLRDNDIFGRTGGEEFAAILLETDGEEAFEVAQRLCEAVADARIVPYPGAGQIAVSVSIGLSELGKRSISLSQLLDEADRAMYSAKQAGRNRTWVHGWVAR
jgi:diguanylate cyclase (GGDEF)-like protein